MLDLFSGMSGKNVVVESVECLEWSGLNTVHWKLAPRHDHSCCELFGKKTNLTFMFHAQYIQNYAL